jgi:hypothetical protein
MVATVRARSKGFSVAKEWRFAYAITGENAGLLYEGLIHSWPVAAVTFA